MTSETINIASRYLQRRVLLLSLIPLGLLFAVTVTLARTYHVREAGLVQEWFQKGNADLSAGRPGAAFEDFRNALSYDPENNLVQMRFAEALLADGRLTEARSYFLNLWERTPGSGEVNLDLAHLSQRTDDADDAIRYFRSAVYGSWEGDPFLQRRKTRVELCQYLLAQGRDTDAQAELAILAADIPPEDASLQKEVGHLFLRAGEPDKALLEFEATLRMAPRDSEALGDAGKAAYSLGDYEKAESFLARARRENPSGEILQYLQTARDVLASDPYQKGLSENEQAQRTLDAFQQGLDRLQECTKAGAKVESTAQQLSDLQVLNKQTEELRMRAKGAALRRNPELRDTVMQFVFRVEQTTSHTCGTAVGEDQALLLIADKHAGGNP